MRGHGVAVEYSMHFPHDYGDSRNFHVHFHITPRRMDKNGLTDKAQELDNQMLSGEHIEAWRQAWQRIVNRALERAGYNEEHRIDMRSYERQGIKKEAQRHMGSKAAALERAGIQTRVGNDNRQRQERNAERERAARAARVTSRSNVIDFQKKSDERERKNNPARQYQDYRERQGRMKAGLQHQRRLEDNLRLLREARERQAEQNAALARAQGRLTPAFNQHTQDGTVAMAEISGPDQHHQEWMERVERAGIEHAERQEARQQNARDITHRAEDGPAAQAEQQRLAKEQRQGQIDEWANQRRAEIQSRQWDERIALDRKLRRAADMKEEEISKLYGNGRRQREKRIDDIETRQEKAGMIYRVFHFRQMRRERDELPGLRKTVENSRMRENEMRATYQREHARQSERLDKAHASENILSERWIAHAFEAERIPTQTRGLEPSQLSRESPQHDMGRTSRDGGDGGRGRFS